MEKEETICCTYCGKALISWKSKDWKARKLHRTCFHKQVADFAHTELMADRLAASSVKSTGPPSSLESEGNFHEILRRATTGLIT